MDGKNQNKIQIKKFSEIDRWSWSMAIDNKKGLVSSSQIDMSFSNKIIEVLNSYGYDISITGEGSFLERNNLTFGSEPNLIEYRADLVQKQDYDDFKYDYLADNDFEEESDMSEEDKNKMEEEYENLEYVEIDSSLTFSFFVGKNVPKVHLKQAGIYYGYLYMRMLHDMLPDFILKPSYEENLLRENSEAFKSYLNWQGIHINNKNVERVEDVNYRIYKDSKFFGTASDELSDYRDLVTELINLK